MSPLFRMSHRPRGTRYPTVPPATDAVMCERHARETRGPNYSFPSPPAPCLRRNAFRTKKKIVGRTGRRLPSIPTPRC